MTYTARDLEQMEAQLRRDDLTVGQRRALQELYDSATASKAGKRKSALMAAVDERVRRLGEVEASPYLTEDERRVRLLKIKDETSREIDGMIEGLQAAEKQARAEAQRVLEEGGSASPAAREQVRRLLDQDVAPANIVERAKGAGDGETLRALRSELRYWATSPGKLNDSDQRAKIAGIQTEIDYTLAEVLPADEAKVVREALALEKEADAASAAAQFAARVSGGQSNLPMARLSMGFAESDAERAADYAAGAGSRLPAPAGVHN